MEARSVTITLNCAELSVRVNDRVLVDGLRLSATSGAFVGILGPNGVGKTLTLMTLAGLRSPSSGSIELNGERLDGLDRRTIARRLGLLLQSHADAFPTTVLESALMGRHARLGLWQLESARDIEIAHAALADMDLEGLEHRQLSTLSGGERRRVALATLLVQDPDIVLLDEPTNHLDPLHKITVLKRMQSASEAGKIIVASLHDPDLAARFAHDVLLLHGNGRWQYGSCTDMLTVQNLERLYGTPFDEFTGNTRRVLLPASI